MLHNLNTTFFFNTTVLELFSGIYELMVRLHIPNYIIKSPVRLQQYNMLPITSIQYTSPASKSNNILSCSL